MPTRPTLAPAPRPAHAPKGRAAGPWALALVVVAHLAGCDPVSPAAPGLVHITRAQRLVESCGEAAGGCATAVYDSRRLQGGHWRETTLPDAGAAPAPGAAPGGRAVAWYRMAYTMPGATPEGGTPAVAIHVPRAFGAPAQVLLNGTVLLDNRAQAREQWNRPLYVTVPRSLSDAWAGSAVELVLGLPHHAGRADFALSTLWVGPQEVVRPLYEQRHWLQVTGPQVSALTIVVLGLFALAFWQHRRREHAYLLLGASALLWWLRNLHHHADAPAAGPGAAWFWWATHASIAWIMVLTGLFAMRLYGARHQRLARGLAAFTVLGSAATLPLWGGDPTRLLPLQHGLNAMVSAGVVVLITLDARRCRLPELSALALVLWALLLMGVHDLLLNERVLPPEAIHLLPYGSLLMFGAFLYAAQRRYLHAITEVEQLNTSLEVRLHERQAELEASWQRLRDAEREQAVLRERQRLMRDMHDGVGAALMSSLVLVEQGRLATPAVAELLRECMDDIKLVIDSMEPVDHDLVALLASLRHRLGRRLELAGLQVDWHVHELPRLPWLDAAAALQILRIVQESLTNVLKHAQARNVTLATELHRDGPRQWVRVIISDDGAGFDAANPAAGGRGRGLRNLRTRAHTLRGRLDVRSEPGHTRVMLELPVNA